MPDRYGFDDLGIRVVCIEEGCDVRGFRWEWPDAKRREHHLNHGARAASPTRPRPQQSGNGTEDSMAGSTKTKVSGREACIAAIRAAGKPLTANEIATAVIASGVVPTLKGKTPKATLSAQITSGAKKGEVFKRVGSTKPSRFDLKSDAPESPAELVEALKAAVKEATAPKKDETPKAKPPESATAEATVDQVGAAAAGDRPARPHPKPGAKTK